MPVRKRNNKRRRADTLDDWEWTFDMGWPCTGELWGIVELDESGQPPRDAVEGAWRRFGKQFMEEFEARNEPFTPWALEQFGDPRCPPA
ncbi:hypothetical protein [uncultured Bradyrhizobium sp.]|uniref:hypothetical protein n=1 Tax=Bradyrhizobium sp. TaxID=376 RepID=UPI0026156B9D|nr:hypothetical protein [uncultured Bradyrhizobium sp.]